MNQIGKRKKRTINGNALRTWALLFLAAGVLGRGLIQNHILEVGNLTTQQLLEVMGASEQAMALATCALVLQALETCAVPLYALMLVEGVQNTSDFPAYFKRILGLAVLCELPYNLAMHGKLLFFSDRNPVFALVMCLVMLYLFSRFPEGKKANTLVKMIITIAAILWCEMLKIEYGSATVLIVSVMWAFRKNSLYRNFAGAAAAIVCTVMSMYFLAAPMAFMIIHGYDGEKSSNSRRVNYLAYPAMLAAVAVIGLVL
ncbi:MAG: hypothetical protein IJB59_05215 [Oscillospiraceae bacterium]|nr:hypothetical protein [Oscillospiraceae bacterium]